MGKVANHAERTAKSNRIKAEQAKEYKKAMDTITKYKRDGKPPKYTDYRLLAYRLSAYIYDKQVDDEPITMTGLRMSVYMPGQTWSNYINGDQDHISALCTHNGSPILSIEGDIDHIVADYQQREDIQPIYNYLIQSRDYEQGDYIRFSDICKNAKDFFLEQVENYTFKRGNVVDIFNSKVHLGYQDETPQAPQTVNQTLIVSGDSADKALAHIGLKLIEE